MSRDSVRGRAFRTRRARAVGWRPRARSSC